MNSSDRVSATSSLMLWIRRWTPFSVSLPHIPLSTVDLAASCCRASHTVCTTASMTPGSSWSPAYMRFVIRSIIGVGRVANKRFQLTRHGVRYEERRLARS